MAIIDVNDNDFENAVLQSPLPVIIDFWAEWCAPCKMIAPILDDIATEYDGKITVAKINIDDNPQIPSTYGVRGIPTMMMFKDSELVASRVGALSKAQLSEWIDEHI